MTTALKKICKPLCTVRALVVQGKTGRSIPTTQLDPWRVSVYSEFSTLLTQHPEAKSGFWIDTNILVSATYDSDKYHDDSGHHLSINSILPK